MEALQVLFFSLPYVFAFGFAVALAAFAGLALGRPILLLGIYLAIFLTFPQSLYGTKEVFAATPIYYRGTGQLFYPAVSWALLAALLWAGLARAFARMPSQPLPDVVKWLLAWLLLFAGHTAVGLALGHEARDVMGSNGFVNIVWMAPLVLLMVWSVSGLRTPNLLTLARVLVLVGLAKASYGLVRLAAFGGDPTNIYTTARNSVGVSITFFDINDSLICVIAFLIAGSLLLVRRPHRAARGWDVVYVLTALVAVACVLLSYRRTAWGGLVLVSALLLLVMSPRWRVPAIAITVPALAAALTAVAAQRLADVQLAGPLRFIFDLVPSRTGAEGTRLLELVLAWEAFATSPIFGIGSWGRFSAGDMIPWQSNDNAGAYLHSGLLHILMKTGLVGLCLFGGLLWAFGRSVQRAWRLDDPAARALVIAGLGGLLFTLPDFLFGTPIPQVRTTQMLGFCLGLPAMVMAADGALVRARARALNQRAPGPAAGASWSPLRTSAG